VNLLILLSKSTLQAGRTDSNGLGHIAGIIDVLVAAAVLSGVDLDLAPGAQFVDLLLLLELVVHDPVARLDLLLVLDDVVLLAGGLARESVLRHDVELHLDAPAVLSLEPKSVHDVVLPVLVHVRDAHQLLQLQDPDRAA